jgi:hypothetical protein
MMESELAMLAELEEASSRDLQYRGHNLIFIVGSSRSGTTWLQRLLASHPQVHTGQESYIFEYLAPPLRMWRRHTTTNRAGSRGGVGLPCYFYEDEFMLALHQHMLNLMQPMLRQLSEGDFFLEKSPAHAQFIPEILELLPESRIIHMLRDARDVTASMLAANESWGSRWAPRHAFRAARKWEKYVRAVRDAQSHVPEGQFIEVRYEDLSAAPAETMRRLATFLNLEWSETDLLQALDANTAENMRAGGGTKIPMHGEFTTASGAVEEPKDFVRKARPQAWKEDLSFIDKAQVWIVARQMMAETGYPWKFPW